MVLLALSIFKFADLYKITLRYKTIYTALLAVVLLLSSCTTRYYTAEFLAPAERFVPAQVQRIGLINHAAVAQSPVYVDGVQVEKADSILLKTVENTLDFFTQLNQDLGRYEVVRLKTRADEGELNSLEMGTSLKDSLIKNNDLDAILSLESAGLELGGNMISNYSATPGMRAEYTIGWKIYDKQPGKIGDEYQQVYVSTYNPANTLQQDESEVRTIFWELLESVAMDAAADYYQRIAPHWVVDYRRFYLSGNEQLKRAAAYIQYDSDWEKAADIWRGLAASEDAKIAYRASFNMALASEMLGNPAVGLNWIEKALAIKNTSLARKYKEVLARQANIHHLLERQLK